MNWDHIWRTYKQEIYQYIYYRIRNHADAEDLSQETFLKAIAAMKKNNVVAMNMPAFLRTIARNLIIDKVRKETRGVPIFRMEGVAFQLAENASHHSYEQVELADLVQTLMNQLTKQQKQLIQYRFFHDLTVKETANLLQLSEGAVKSMQFRLRKTLLERAAVQAVSM